MGPEIRLLQKNFRVLRARFKFYKILENVFLYKSSTKKPDYSAKIDDFASKSVRAKLSSSQTVLLNELAEKQNVFGKLESRLRHQIKFVLFMTFQKFFFSLYKRKIASWLARF